MYVYLLSLNESDRCPVQLRVGGMNVWPSLPMVPADSIFDSAARRIQFLRQPLLELS
jgi:hypothetical protein